MTATLYLGIDPGASGGLCLLNANGIIIDVLPIPDTEHDVGEYLREFHQQIHYAAIEFVQAFPGQGVSSSFNFGRNYGFWRGLLVAYRIPFHEVTPRKWQQIVGVPALPKRKEKRGTTAKKNITKAAAQRLWPSVKFTHATADAALIAEYARRVYARFLARTEIEGVLA